MEINSSGQHSEKVIGRSIDERAFLHDLCNKLQVAYGMSEVSMKYMKADEEADFDLSIERVTKLKNSLQNIIDEIKDRRVVLHGISKVQKSSPMIE